MFDNIFKRCHIQYSANKKNYFEVVEILKLPQQPFYDVLNWRQQTLVNMYLPIESKDNL